MKKGLRKKRVMRVFTEEVRRQVVKEYEMGMMSIKELCEFYGISSTSLYNWINKYSKFAAKSLKVVEMAESKEHRIKELQERVKELERAVGQKQMQIEYLEKMIDIAKEEYQIDIKKNYSIPRFDGSENIKAK